MTLVLIYIYVHKSRGLCMHAILRAILKDIQLALKTLCQLLVLFTEVYNVGVTTFVHLCHTVHARTISFSLALQCQLHLLAGPLLVHRGHPTRWLH